MSEIRDLRIKIQAEKKERDNKKNSKEKRVNANLDYRNSLYKLSKKLKG